MKTLFNAYLVDNAVAGEDIPWLGSAHRSTAMLVWFSMFSNQQECHATSTPLLGLIWLGQLRVHCLPLPSHPLWQMFPPPNQPSSWDFLALWLSGLSLLPAWFPHVTAEDFTLSQKWRYAWNSYTRGLPDLCLYKLMSPSALSSFMFLGRGRSLG